MFTDDFNRADEDLEDSADWTQIDTNAGAATIVSNVLTSTQTGGVQSYLCPDQGSADHYSQGVIKTGGGTFPCCVRMTNGNNFIGARHTGGDWELFKRVSGSFTLLGDFTASLVSGDILRVDADGNDITVKINATLRIGPITETFNNTETRQGLSPRSTVTSDWMDDFEADSLAPPVGGRIMGSIAGVGGLAGMGGIAGQGGGLAA